MMNIRGTASSRLFSAAGIRSLIQFNSRSLKDITFRGLRR